MKNLVENRGGFVVCNKNRAHLLISRSKYYGGENFAIDKEL